ncbi:hypothetical protein, partial [Chryseobacterium hagamense]|uniref:hypothetical protein n=1 Tax=Chryseobacterium hagamense TaxID=395935 RepID=UPI001479060E
GGGSGRPGGTPSLLQLITTLNYIFQFGEWDYLYTEKNGMMKGTKGAEFASESMLHNNPYNNKYFNTAEFKKINNIIAGLNISITIVKLPNGEYGITPKPANIAFNSSAYDAAADGDATITYSGKGKGFLNIQFQITNNEQIVERKIGNIDGKVNIKDSHTALLTVSYPFNVIENNGSISLKFGHPTNYKAYNLSALMIAEGIRYIPFTKFEFLGPPIQTVDYNYQLKKK